MVGKDDIQGGGESRSFRLSRLRDLAILTESAPGNRVEVDEDATAYYCVGRARTDMCARVGIPVSYFWLPEHALRHIQDRHPVITDPLKAAELILQQPLTVRRDRIEPVDKVIFYANGDALREAGLLISQSSPYVSAGVELRNVSGEILLRLFHLSPHRSIRGELLWP